MTHPTFIERLEQRRSKGSAVIEAPTVASSPAHHPSTKTISRRASVVVPMTVAQSMAQLLTVLARHHQLAAITLSDTPTKKELLAILENRTAEVLSAVNEKG